ncbi:efflux RND transporter periplasmic adaptor subunit, partial [Klebsiella pneumoniae]|nr:efflux RND transporter periplasmic adaptor subunit [Klebsiella pneumoniae]
DVLSVKTEPFTVFAELPGRIEPVRVAEVRARVAGIVLKRTFEEGADVKAGDVLFQIDPAPFKAALSRAQGELARAEAQLFQAQAMVRRYEPLVKIDAVSQQDFDNAMAALQSAQADKRSAQANVETARLDLGYAEVRAPIAGRIGRAQVTEGALVGQGEATLL